eukprot:TRINITY_DN68612_c0_g1_i1.p1 TRINITY_DN68612_c0_g1~~TRINITY_DN68612_c0_g1_i1.p1  ORF type:complete len:225 (-),score=16.38 TRINITY_DN68612_c0_g1_i1:155-745(-)
METSQLTDISRWYRFVGKAAIASLVLSSLTIYLASSSKRSEHALLRREIKPLETSSAPSAPSRKPIIRRETPTTADTDLRSSSPQRDESLADKSPPERPKEWGRTMRREVPRAEKVHQPRPKEWGAVMRREARRALAQPPPVEADANIEHAPAHVSYKWFAWVVALAAILSLANQLKSVVMDLVKISSPEASGKKI